MPTRFLDQLRSRILLCDGAIGTWMQSHDFDLEKDFLGRENCSEVLSLTRPDFIEMTHVAYLEAGADCVETNTFGGNKIVLAEFDLAERTREINRRAAEIARVAAQRF